MPYFPMGLGRLLVVLTVLLLPPSCLIVLHLTWPSSYFTHRPCHLTTHAGSSSWRQPCSEWWRDCAALAAQFSVPSSSKPAGQSWGCPR